MQEKTVENLLFTSIWSFQKIKDLKIQHMIFMDNLNFVLILCVNNVTSLIFWVNIVFCKQIILLIFCVNNVTSLN